MTTPNTEIGAITTATLRTTRAMLDEAAAIARAADGCAVGGQPARALMIALDVEPLAVEANSLLQGLAILTWMSTQLQQPLWSPCSSPARLWIRKFSLPPISPTM